MVVSPYFKSGQITTCIGGSTSSDLWIGGTYSNYSLHYDGSTWRQDSLPIVNPPLVSGGDMFRLVSIVSGKIGNVYAIGTSHFQTEKILEVNYFFSWKNNRWSLIDSALIGPGRVENKWGFNDLWISPKNILYSAGRYISMWKDGKWTFMYDAWVNKRSITGSNDDNIFVVGDLGSILHYNGTDWYEFPRYNNIGFNDVWTDGNEVFIVGTTNSFPMKSVVVHGK